MPEGKILVVDDEERQREIYRDILQGEGYDAETAASGEAALKLLAQTRFDLVVTDLNLTGMTGLQLLSEIVVDDPTVAVIMITGYPSIQSAVEATRKGVYQYLEKPVDRDDAAGGGGGSLPAPGHAEAHDHWRFTRHQGHDADDPEGGAHAPTRC